VLARLARIENGNFGDYKQLSSDLCELRFFFHGGLRIYYSVCDGKIVLLLTRIIHEYWCALAGSFARKEFFLSRP